MNLLSPRFPSPIFPYSSFSSRHNISCNTTLPRHSHTHYHFRVSDSNTGSVWGETLSGCVSTQHVICLIPEKTSYLTLEPFLSNFSSKISPYSQRIKNKQKTKQKKRGGEELLYENLKKNTQNNNGQLKDSELVSLCISLNILNHAKLNRTIHR